MFVEEFKGFAVSLFTGFFGRQIKVMETALDFVQRYTRSKLTTVLFHIVDI